MAAIPMVYFQAGATAIPTILIALAIGAKQGQTWAEGLQTETRLGRISSMLLVVFCVFLMFAGEASALIALFTNDPDITQADMVWFAVMIGLLLLTLELIKPYREVLKKRERTFLQIMIGILWLLISASYLVVRSIYFLA